MVLGNRSFKNGLKNAETFASPGSTESGWVQSLVSLPLNAPLALLQPTLHPHSHFRALTRHDSGTLLVQCPFECFGGRVEGSLVFSPSCQHVACTNETCTRVLTIQSPQQRKLMARCSTPCLHLRVGWCHVSAAARVSNAVPTLAQSVQPVHMNQKFQLQSTASLVCYF